MMTNNTYSINYFEEPLLEFNYGQTSNYSKDGLFLYGPLGSKKEIRYGVIGHQSGIDRFYKWLNNIQKHISSPDANKLHFSSFPGFEAVFNSSLKQIPGAKLLVSEQTILDNIKLSNSHEAIYKTVSLYTDKLIEYKQNEDEQPDLWFVIIPEEIYKYGRPQRSVPKEEKIISNLLATNKIMKKQQKDQMFLFTEMTDQAKMYNYALNFRRQLKARLLERQIPIQIIRETTIAPNDFIVNGEPIRKPEDPATVAWNLCTTILFKSGVKPWKLANIRPGVCYIGLVFKKLDEYIKEGNACCGAQMFLDSGDGLVFKGAVGNWYDKNIKQFHLTKQKAKELMSEVISGYVQKQNEPPKELFIHGRTFFNDEEWEGFKEAIAPYSIKLIGIRIYESRNGIKLYRANGTRPIVRGTACKINSQKAYLWTSGYVERFNTYPGFNVPNPISIEICKGTANLNVVIKDIFALTKVNFNSCSFGDSVPVTLKFADAVGEILTAAPLKDIPPLPFRFYI